MSQRCWVKIGIVGKAHGLLGAFIISGRDEALEKSVRQVRIGKSLDKSQSYEIMQSRMQGKRPLVSLKGFTGRHRVDEIKGMSVWCKRDDLSIDDEEEYIWNDLIGRQIIDAKGVPMGKVEHVVNHGATDIIELTGEQGRLSIPFVDAYFDMSFKADSSPISLIVEESTFEEAWESKEEKLSFLSVHPEFIANYFQFGVFSAAQKSGLELESINLRDFAIDKHGSVDDRAYGGGDGMIMRPEPLANAVKTLRGPNSIVVYTGPAGKSWNQSEAEKLHAIA